MSAIPQYPTRLSRRGVRATGHPFVNWAAKAADVGAYVTDKWPDGCSIVAPTQVSRGFGLGTDPLKRPVLSVPHVDADAFSSIRWVGACFYLDASPPGMPLKTWVTAQLANEPVELGDWVLLVGSLGAPLPPERDAEMTTPLSIWLPALTGVLETVLSDAFGGHIVDIGKLGGAELRLTAYDMAQDGPVHVERHDIQVLPLLVFRHQNCEIPALFKPARSR